MNCKSYHSELTAYLDGELDDGRTAQVASHLEQCGRCARECRELRDSATFVSAHSRSLEPGDEMWNNLRIRLAELPEREEDSSGWMPSWWIGGRRLAAWSSLAATAALAFGFYSYFSHLESQKTLEHYMWRYVQERELQAFGLPARLDAAYGPIQEEAFRQPWGANPFMELESGEAVNPFRVVDQ